MRQIHFRATALIAWGLFLFYIERIGGPIGITDLAYALMAAVVVIVLVVPSLHRVPLSLAATGSILLLVALKIMLGYQVWASGLFSTALEALSIVIAASLAYWLGKGVNELERAIIDASVGLMEKRPQAFSIEQGEMYREVRRARNYQRPLSLMAIGVGEDSVDGALDRLLQEAQRAMVRQYVISSVSKTLFEVLEDFNVVALRKDHFLVLLPEVAPEQLPDLTKRLRDAVFEKVGVSLRIGTASLQSEVLTFDAMMRKAVEEMEMGSERRVRIVPSPGGQGPPNHMSRRIYDLRPEERVDGFGDHKPA
ncbi:MAG: hypothetical protein M1358_11520 [Chloroflexi bacterium]|nr:hypothetical protein [Chloroflexota bacterium]